MPRFKVKLVLISSLQKLYGDWVQALGALISGIVWLDKRWLWLVDGNSPAA